MPRPRTTAVTLRPSSRPALARAAETRRRRAVGLRGRAQLGVEGFEVAGGALAALELGAQGIEAAGQLGGAHAVLAREVVDRLEALLDLLQPRGVEVEALEQAGDRVGGLADLHLGLLRRALGLGEAGLQRRERREALPHRGELVVHAALGAVELFLGRLALLQQAAGIGQPAVVCIQLLELPRRQLQGFQLAQLVAQVVQLRGIAARKPAHALDGGLGRRMPAGRLGDRGEWLAMGAEVVEELALGLAAQQALVLVLAVDLHEPLAELAQVGERRGGAVDEGPRAAVGADHAAQQALAGVVRVLHRLLAQPGARGEGSFERELGADLGLRLPGAHEGGVGAVAQHQAERVDQDRLAGAGFAGEHREAGRELEVERIDDGEVADPQRAQHGQRSQARAAPLARPAEPQWSLLRRMLK
jgi:hypothetical protein